MVTRRRENVFSSEMVRSRGCIYDPLVTAAPLRSLRIGRIDAPVVPSVIDKYNRSKMRDTAMNNSECDRKWRQCDKVVRVS